MPAKNFLLLSFFSLLLLLTNHTKAQQNLVPNFDFEQYSSCPTTGNQADFCVGWSKYCTSNYTPDYYNACSSTMGVPQNYLFYQTDHRNCGGYIGLITWSTLSNEREHIGIQLNQPLVIGQKYYLSFYTVRGGGYGGGFYLESPSNNIGLRLSTVPYNELNPAPIDNFSHLRSTSIISDTANWVRISGSIVADSAYQYLMLGNFYDDANTDTTTLTCGNCLNNYSYYLLDDICISTDSTLCDGGIDLIPCNISVEGIDFNVLCQIFPNPTNDFVTVMFPTNTNVTLTLCDALGKIILIKEIKNEYSANLNLSFLPKGCYILKVKSNYHNQTAIKKIIKL